MPRSRSGWELFNLANDRSETKNLAGAESERVRAMSFRWLELDEQWKKDSRRGDK